ncbi:hypothetical protein Esi_0171_0038 [Ectocarpus siliculosus]|uniref:Uncharacterized protein n=1 Tax=Ectocarpus siliculosus TaxID=2880 RepID=D7FMV9_ECTSI|nr:hypothetical protein Esi_0171_0038 [Ectocarpus siliculosus]|eukprot:CBJ30023.1 hypothetical protein Esi_0171_0038 [Ectocarpus siliculosus]
MDHGMSEDSTAFCNGCLDQLGEGTAMALASSDKAWQCLCCDQSQLLPLQTLFAEAKRDPPLITKVLARLAEHSEAEGEGVSGARSSLEQGEEADDEELDQQLVDASFMVEDVISEAQAQTVRSGEGGGFVAGSAGCGERHPAHPARGLGDQRDIGGSGVLEEGSSAGGPRSVDILLSKAEKLLNGLPYQTRNQPPGADFFKRFFRAVNGTTDENEIRRSGVGLWGPKTVAAAAERTVSFFREEQAENGRPSTEDVKAWGLHGDAAEQLAMLLRWMSRRLATNDDTTAAPSSFSGGEDEDNAEQLPPSDREGLVSECKDMTRRIKADDATTTPEISGMGGASDPEAFWQSTSLTVLLGTWHHLRAQLKEAESKAAADVEDLGSGTSTAAYLESSWRVFNYTPEKAADKLKEAMASDGLPATRLRDEATDSAAVNRERQDAVSTGSQSRRPRAPLARKTAGTAASSSVPSSRNANPPSLSSGVRGCPTQGVAENSSAACPGRGSAGKAVDGNGLGSTVGEPAPGVAGQAAPAPAATTSTSTTVTGGDDGNDIVDASKLETERVRPLEPQLKAEMKLPAGTAPGGGDKEVVDLTRPDETGPKGVEKTTASHTCSGNGSAEVHKSVPRGSGEGGSAEAAAGRHDNRCTKDRREGDPRAILGVTSPPSAGWRSGFEPPPLARDVSERGAGNLPKMWRGGNVDSLSLSDFWESEGYAGGEKRVRSDSGCTGENDGRRERNRPVLTPEAGEIVCQRAEAAPSHGGGPPLQHQMAAEYAMMTLEDILSAEEEPVEASSTQKRKDAKRDGQANKRQKMQR